MKKLLIAIFFLITVICSAQSPFVGEWQAQWYGLEPIQKGVTKMIPLGEKKPWTFTETSVTVYDVASKKFETRNYTYNDKQLLIGKMIFVWDKIHHGTMMIRGVKHEVTFYEMVDRDDGANPSVILQLLRVDE